MVAGSKLPESFTSNIAYGRQIVSSSIGGASSAVREALSDDTVGARFQEAVRTSWKPAVVGACVGFVVSAVRKQSARTGLLNGLAAGALGFSAGMIWASRDVTSAAVRGAVANVNATRDAHWLERNPIDYA